MVKLFEKYYYRNKRGKVVILLLVCFFLSFNCMALENDSICSLPRYKLETQISPFWFFYTHLSSPTKYPGSNKVKKHDLGFVEYFYHSQIFNDGINMMSGFVDYPKYPYTMFPDITFDFLLSNKTSSSTYLWSGFSYLNEIDAFFYDPPSEYDHETVWVPYEYHYRAISLPLGIQFLFRSKNHKKRFTSLMLGLYSDFSFYKHLTEDEIYYHYDVHWGGGDTLHDTLQTVEQTTHHVQFSRLSAYVGVGKQYFLGKRWSLSWQVSAFEPFYFRKFLFDVTYFKLGAQFGVGYTLK